MKKKYFAKYLPVEGEVKDGDHYALEGSILICVADSKLEKEFPLPYADSLKRTKMRLFLCSRDIQINDKFFFEDKLDEMISRGSLDNDGRYWTTAKDTHYSKDKCYKVIGEISSDAVWVTEGMEFNEDEVQISIKEKRECSCKLKGLFNKKSEPNCYHLEQMPHGSCSSICTRKVEYTSIKILNPTCKHFH